ncbi:nitrate reductase molybdenum cofactor assembly chaperone [Actinoplanes sp. NPDC051861]|uniref:nitrate reductase molybdenum cofactor assembly chaperone n=1 Tax=Actinoplanes sp. NPDC051861 TaxID=3155170 RepID=UPI003438A37C
MQSLLLGYPDDRYFRNIGLVERVVGTLDSPVGAPLGVFLRNIRQMAPGALAAEYVSTFDQRKRCCLYLTYYAYGDTRKRGMALLNLKQTYAAKGQHLSDEELPDHLAVILEFAAAEPESGRRLLQDHRAGLELLRLALKESSSPWASVLESISATLPPLKGDEHTAIARLAAAGPPAEEVGYQ